MRERIFLTLVNKDKLPFTNAGIATIQGHMQSVLNEGITVGGLSNFSVNVPSVTDIPRNERANRVVEGFSFEATLVGSVHFATIRGNLVI